MGSSLILGSGTCPNSPTTETTVLKVLAKQSNSTILAIITIFYVTFTYFLLKTTYELNRTLLKPFIKISWKNGNKPERIAVTDNQLAQTETDPQNWIFVEIKNVRDKLISEITLTANVTSSGPTRIGDFKLTYAVTDIDLSKDNIIEIGMINLMAIHATNNVSINLSEVKYKSAESSEELIEYSGKKNYSTNGKKQ